MFKGRRKFFKQISTDSHHKKKHIMNNSLDTDNNQFTLPKPRTSLQNVGEKLEEREEERTGRSFHAFGKDGFTFLDFLDVINPLQNIPLVGTMYRSITGDQIDPGSRIAGSGLFGGPIGTVVALANVTIEQKTGQDIGSHMMALFTKQDDNLKTQISDDFANTSESAGITSDASPITTHAEVLEWAQREIAHSAETAREAQSKNITKLAKNVSSNVEVLNWAQEKNKFSHPTIETSTNSSKNKTKDTKQANLKESEAASVTSYALGRDQAQLNGATSPLGGWFSETMLLALARYSESAQLDKNAVEKRSVEVADLHY